MECNILLPLCSIFKGSCVIDLLHEQVTLTGVCIDKNSVEIHFKPDTSCAYSFKTFKWYLIESTRMADVSAHNNIREHGH